MKGHIGCSRETGTRDRHCAVDLNRSRRVCVDSWRLRCGRRKLEDGAAAICPSCGRHAVQSMIRSFEQGQSRLRSLGISAGCIELAVRVQ